MTVCVIGFFSVGFAQAKSEPGILPPDPVSEVLVAPDVGLPTSFCAEWNPDFPFNGGTCCGKRVVQPSGKLKPRRRRGPSCPPQRFRESFCSEETPEQRDYAQKVLGGSITDPLLYLERELVQRRDSDPQAVCTPNDGFLAWGRPLVPSEKNGIRLRRPDRCVHYGSDRMVAMLEWIGRKVKERTQELGTGPSHMIVGDISAPRGGCLAGGSGRRGHFSHMNGSDVDLGFLDPKRKFEGRALAHEQFDRRFDPEWNWWFIKTIFKNPYVCVKAAFLDHRLISKMRKIATSNSVDPDWEKFSKFIKHVKFHRNHFHVRIGTRFGVPGCQENPVDSSEVSEEEATSGSM